MKFVLLQIVGAFATGVAALPPSVNHVVLEKRRDPSSWAPKPDAKPDKGVMLPVKIGLRESNIDKGHQLLMNIADPASKAYGKHMSLEEVSVSPTTHDHEY